MDGRHGDMLNPKWRMLNINLGARDSHRKEHRGTPTSKMAVDIFGS